MCVRCGTGKIAWCTDPDRHGDGSCPVCRSDARVPLNGHPHPPGEFIGQINDAGKKTLMAWLERPNGALSIGRVTFEAGGAGVMVRVRAWGKE